MALQNPEVIKEMIFKKNVILFLLLIIQVSAFKADELHDCEQFDLKSQASLNFNTKNNILSVYFDELYLRSISKFKNEETNMRVGFYKGLDEYVKKTYSTKSYKLESAEVKFSKKNCSKYNLYIMTIPIESIKFSKDENTNLKELEQTNLNAIELNDFTIFK